MCVFYVSSAVNEFTNSNKRKGKEKKFKIFARFNIYSVLWYRICICKLEGHKLYRVYK